MKKIPVKQVILDFDSPFLNNLWDDFFLCLQDIFRVDHTEYEKYFFSSSYYLFLVGKYNFDQMFLDFLGNMLTGMDTIFYENREKLLSCYRKVVQINTHQIKKIPTLIEEKLGKKLNFCFMGNFDEIHLEYLRENFVKNRLPHKIFASCEYESIKPEQQFYYFIREKLLKEGIHSEETMVLDDNVDNLLAAKDLGFLTIFMDHKEDAEQYFSRIFDFLKTYFN